MQSELGNCALDSIKPEQPPHRVDVTAAGQLYAATQKACLITFFVSFHSVVIITKKLIFDFSEFDLVVLCISLAKLIVLPIAAIACWRSIGADSPAQFSFLKKVLTASLVIHLLSTGIFYHELYLNYEDIPDDKYGHLTLISLSSTLVLITTAWGLFCISRFGGCVVPEIGATLYSVLAEFEKIGSRPSPEAGALIRIDRPAGLFLGCAGIVVLVVGALAFNFSWENHGSLVFQNFLTLSLFLFVTSCVDVLGVWLLLQAKRHFIPSAEAVLAVDRRSPVLYLRSFSDEAISIYRQGADSLLDYSLETRLLTHFRRFGPFLAIASPQDKVPQVGALRLSIDDDAWRSRVLQLMGDASVIIASVGASQWIQWELGELLRSNSWRKTIFLIPEPKSQGEKSAETDAFYRERAAALVKALGDREYEWFADNNLQPEHIRAVLFEFGPIVVTSERSDRNAHHVAALLAHYVLVRFKSGLSVLRSQSEIADARNASAYMRKQSTIGVASLAAVALLAVAGLAALNWSKLSKYSGEFIHDIWSGEQRFHFANAPVSVVLPPEYIPSADMLSLNGPKGISVTAEKFDADKFDELIAYWRDSEVHSKLNLTSISAVNSTKDGIARSKVIWVEKDKNRAHMIFLRFDDIAGRIFVVYPVESYSEASEIEASITKLLESATLSLRRRIKWPRFSIAGPEGFELRRLGVPSQLYSFVDASESSKLVAIEIIPSVKPCNDSLRKGHVDAMKSDYQEFQVLNQKCDAKGPWEVLETEVSGLNNTSQTREHVIIRTQTIDDRRSFYIIGRSPENQAAKNAALFRSAAETIGIK